MLASSLVDLKPFPNSDHNIIHASLKLGYVPPLTPSKFYRNHCNDEIIKSILAEMNCNFFA